MLHTHFKSPFIVRGFFLKKLFNLSYSMLPCFMIVIARYFMHFKKVGIFPRAPFLDNYQHFTDVSSDRSNRRIDADHLSECLFKTDRCL